MSAKNQVSSARYGEEVLNNGNLTLIDALRAGLHGGGVAEAQPRRVRSTFSTNM